MPLQPVASHAAALVAQSPGTRLVHFSQPASHPCQQANAHRSSTQASQFVGGIKELQHPLHTLQPSAEAGSQLFGAVGASVGAVGASVGAAVGVHWSS